MGLFNKINLETPESVELEFNLAGIGNRAYALSLDYLVLGCLIVIVLVIWAFLYAYILSISNFAWFEKLGLWLFAIQMLIIFFIYTGYFVVFETLWQGQTPGKRWVNIRVITDDGRIINITHALLRALLRPVDEFLFIGSFLIIFTKKEKRLGDLVAGTVVIREGQKTTKDKLKLSPEASSLATTIKDAGDTSLLLPEDFAVVREYLQRRQNMTPEARDNISKKLTYKLRKKLNLPVTFDIVNPEVFLEAIYLIYV
jgi:uncharacterized RDD family membrane protein YckC